MHISEFVYEEALAQLRYVGSIKQALADLLEHMAYARRSQMPVALADYALAVAVIEEAIDELYYPHCLKARQLKEGYERECWRSRE